MTRILVLVRVIFASPPPPSQVKPSLQCAPVARLEALGIVYRLRA